MIDGKNVKIIIQPVQVKKQIFKTGCGLYREIVQYQNGFMKSLAQYIFETWYIRVAFFSEKCLAVVKKV